ncbi:MAG: magnesium transporter CorA family protein [Acidimicrobiales bacterium]
MGDVLTRVYRKGVLEAEGFAVADVSEHLERPDTVVWVDFCAPSKEQLAELADELGLHELAVEDALGPHQRPKVDRYDTHLFLSCHSVRLEAGQSRLEDTEVDAFVNERWLITVRKGDAFPIDPVLERWDRSSDLAALGVGYLVYGLLDVIVDTHFDAVTVFDDYYEEVSENIFAEKPLDPTGQRRWFEMHRALVAFHRLVVPMREVVSGLMRREHTAVAPELYPYFQDVYDHILRVTESSDSLRELVGTIAATNLSLRDYHQNQIVKKVSGWAAIIAVPALITGYYGMNVPYPGFAQEWGFVASTVVMVSASGGLYLVFRRRDWL